MHDIQNISGMGVEVMETGWKTESGSGGHGFWTIFLDYLYGLIFHKNASFKMIFHRTEYPWFVATYWRKPTQKPTKGD